MPLQSPAPFIESTSPARMTYRRLGRTGLQVSSVGFGTSQLRRVLPTVAIDTLLRGFDLGVNIVHVAPDYGGTEDLVAQAIARTSKKVIVASNSYDVHHNRTGRVRHFEKLFETTCRKLKTDRVELYGIASVDDREALGENVWGRHGMVEFLQRMKEQGRIGSIFCTSHGSPEFNAKLIRSGVFDAIMISYNALGFHLLTMTPTENVARNQAEVFPLCGEHDVGLMIMLPLAGGMLCRTKAFDQNEDNPDGGINAGDALRSILAHDEVSSVMPGTASVAEAEENAGAGFAWIEPSSTSAASMSDRLKVLQTTLCNRCGSCELTCSQKLPIRWLFRAAYMSAYPNSPYETSDEVEYFRLHPGIESTCETCPNVTCTCPAGIDVSQSLILQHQTMVDHAKRGLVAPPVSSRKHIGNRWFGAWVVRRELPREMMAGQTYTGRLFAENTGLRRWHPPGSWHKSSVQLEVSIDGAKVNSVPVREKVGRGLRAHFVFEISPPRQSSSVRLSLRLVRDHPWMPDRRGLILVDDSILIREAR